MANSAFTQNTIVQVGLRSQETQKADSRWDSPRIHVRNEANGDGKLPGSSGVLENRWACWEPVDLGRILMPDQGKD